MVGVEAEAEVVGGGEEEEDQGEPGHHQTHPHHHLGHGPHVLAAPVTSWCSRDEEAHILSL